MNAHMEISGFDVASPAMRRRQASLHSWMISVAYFLFFASPEKAKVFSGFPSAWVGFQWHVPKVEYGVLTNLVDPEPLVGCADETREMPLDVLDVVEFGGKGVADIDDDDFPVGLALVEESHDAEDLYLLDLADVANLFADLADIKGVVVALCLGLLVLLGRVFPGLGNGSGQTGLCEIKWGRAHLGERTVVPDVSVVREAIANEARFTLLDVLLDVVEVSLLVDLHLGVGPARDLDDHVEDAPVLVDEEGDVVEGRDDVAIFLDVDTVPLGGDGSSRRRGGAGSRTLGVGGRDGTGGVCWEMK